VGQCEISHPVVNPNEISLSFSEESQDEEDGLGAEIEARPLNVMYQQDKGTDYQPLPSRITRQYIPYSKQYFNSDLSS